jgi:hypothetical protein
MSKKTKEEYIEVDEGASGSKMVKMDFPSNAHKNKSSLNEEQPTGKKLEKITTGTVITKKKSFSKKLAEVFIGDDVNNVSSYILYDVLIPAAKSTLSDMITTGIELLLYGEARGNNTRRDRTKSYVSYNSYYKGERENKSRAPSRQNRAMHNFNDIIIESRGEAEEVLSHLVDLVEDYGQATVADLYDLVGITTNFTDHKYGWTNVSAAGVRPVRGGYLIELPRVILLD